MKTHAFAFAQDVDQQIEKLSDQAFHLREGRSKRLQEELLPISRFAVNLKVPGLHVEVEAFENNGAADAHISISGYNAMEFDVQVTYDYSYEESLRRELLHADGFAPGAGEITRDKNTKKIVATMAAVDHDGHAHVISQRLVAMFKRKANMAYVPGTVLLLAFDEVALCGHGQWSKLMSALEDDGCFKASKYRWVFLINCANNELRQAA